MTAIQNITLGEIADFVNGGAWNQDEYSIDGIPVVRVTDIRGETVDLSDCKHLPKTSLQKYSKYLLLAGDLVICTVGPHPSQPGSVVGRVAVIPPGAQGALLNQNDVRIRSALPQVSQDWLSYLARSKPFHDYIVSCATGSASQVRMAIRLLKQMRLEVPPLPIQRRIAGILSAYDDLIENSQRRIKILEEMARRLYREWFVYFRFPGHEGCRLVDSPLGEIPEGWEVANFGELYNTGSGGAPSRAHPEYYENGSIDWVKSQELLDGFVLSTEERITEAALKKSSAKLFPANTVLIALYGATIGKLAILSCPAATNQACCAVLPKHSALGREFAFLTLLLNRERIIGLRLGAAQQNISQVLLRNFECLKPPFELLHLFSDQTAPFLDQTLTL
jgi:type I restriction enzyme S subunit